MPISIISGSYPVFAASTASTTFVACSDEGLLEAIAEAAGVLLVAILLYTVDPSCMPAFTTFLRRPNCSGGGGVDVRRMRSAEAFETSSLLTAPRYPSMTPRISSSSTACEPSAESSTYPTCDGSILAASQACRMLSCTVAASVTASMHAYTRSLHSPDDDRGTSASLLSTSTPAPSPTK